jgi:hypothetical protein
VSAIAREERADGRSALILRSQNDSDISADLDATERRDLARIDGVSVGRAQLRIDLTLLDDGWRTTLVEVLEALGRVQAVAA